MHTTNLRKVGGSVMLAVPPAILDMLDLEAGATVALAVSDGRMVVEPQSKPRYTLDELLAQYKADVLGDDNDPEWLAIEPVGREL